MTAGREAGLLELVRRLEAEVVIRVDERGLEELLASAELVREVESGCAGPIRVLRLGGAELLQERTTRGELLVRRLRTDDEADRLIAQRLDAYERMWDG